MLALWSSGIAPSEQTRPWMTTLYSQASERGDGTAQPISPTQISSEPHFIGGQAPFVLMSAQDSALLVAGVVAVVLIVRSEAGVARRAALA